MCPLFLWLIALAGVVVPTCLDERRRKIAQREAEAKKVADETHYEVEKGPYR